MKLIKRKVNSCNRKSSEEDDFYDYSERESRIRPKMNIEDIYMSVTKTLEDLSRRQQELEVKIDSLDSSNEDISQENSQISTELDDKRAYVNKLETLILFIIQKNSLSNKLFETKNFFPNEAVSLSLLAASYDQESKAQYVKSLCDNMDSEKNLKSLENEKINLDEVETADCQEHSEKIDWDKKNEMTETNVSSPTSLISSIDYSNKLKNYYSYKNPLTSNKRKRTEDEIESHSYGCKIQDSLFEEMTRLTPCLISSPTLSPQNKNHNISNFN